MNQQEREKVRCLALKDVDTAIQKVTLPVGQFGARGLNQGATFDDVNDAFHALAHAVRKMARASGVEACCGLITVGDKCSC